MAQNRSESYRIGSRGPRAGEREEVVMEWVGLDLSGKTALVTGGSRGLGLAIASALGAQGARVAICSRKPENVENAVSELEEQGCEVLGQTANAGKSEQVDALLGAVGEAFGRLDIVVNNVGMNIFTPSVAQVDEGLWDKILEGNLKSAFLVSGRAVPLLKRSGGGKIINISSVAARKAARGMGVYCVAKAGLDMLTKVLASELAGEGITVNAVAPGVIRTRFSEPLWSDQGILESLTGAIPLGRIAETGDVVGAVLYLASPLSDYVNGEVLTVDGGYTA